MVPATIFFLTWYFGFIILAGYAPDFMGSEFIVDGLTVGYVLALSQFVMTWVLGWMYVRRADRVFDPLAERVGPAGARGRASRPRRGGAGAAQQALRALPPVRWRPNDAHRRSQRDRTGGLRRRRRRHDGGDLLRVEARVHGHRLLGGRTQPHRPAERLRHRGRLHVGRVVPRHRRPDLPVRVRRLPLLRRLPRGLPDRALPARRADAQQREVHDRGRARVPAEAEAGALGGRARNAGRGGLLPDRADGRRGRADRGARGHRLLRSR